MNITDEMVETIAERIYEDAHAGMSNVWGWNDGGLDHEHPDVRQRFLGYARSALAAALTAGWEGEDKLTVDQAWTILCETPDITSPEEYPDHALITMEQLGSFMAWAAAPASDPDDDGIMQIAVHLDCEPDTDSILHTIREIQADLGIAKEAAPASAPEPVQIKQLEWREGFPAKNTIAPQPFGDNYVISFNDDVWWIFSRRFATLDEAKAAAQADFEARIRSALITTDKG